MAQNSEMRLFDDQGQRLYLTPEERRLFADTATQHSISNEARTFCRTLYYTGCRPSEALQLTSDRVDFKNECLVIRSLKKRKDPATGEAKVKYRAIPVPPSFLDELNLVHNLKGNKESFLLWDWSRATGWSRVKEIMDKANIVGVHATGKGLRHGFGVAHAVSKTPLPSLQKWMGHEDIQTTAIYMQAVGDEERELASAAWD